MNKRRPARDAFSFVRHPEGRQASGRFLQPASRTEGPCVFEQLLRLKNDGRLFIPDRSNPIVILSDSEGP